MFKVFFEVTSGEWMLRKLKSNGGEVIAIRSMFVAVQLVACFLFLKNLIDPKLTSTISYYAFREQIIDISPLFGGLYCGIYLALYSRFSSQWTYLANVYNLIKQSEMQAPSDPILHRRWKRKLACWKAGYIEDADVLHLIGKDNVAVIVHHWGKDLMIKEAFIRNAAGGQVRWEALLRLANCVYSKSNEKYN